MKQISKDAKLLIASDLMYSLTAIFVETFLVAYFLQITNDNLATISLYYIIVYTLLSFGIVLIGKIIKQHRDKTKQILSFGVITRALFILLIVILSEKIAEHFVLIGIIYAISEILYWGAHELIYIEVTTDNNRQKYMSIKKILGKIINIISPILLGASIELYSFSKIAIYVLFLSIIQIIITMCIKVDENIKSEKCNYKKFLINIKNLNLYKIKLYNIAGIAYGIVESSISTLIIVIIMMTFKTSFNLGMLSTIFAICSIVSLILYNKYYNKNNSKFILIFCSIIIVVGVLGLLIDINKITLIIYNFCYAITFCVFDALYNTKKGDLVKECKIENYKEEYIGCTSVTLGFGRVLGYALILLTSFSTNMIILKILLSIVTLFTPIYCYLMYKLENK